MPQVYIHTPVTPLSLWLINSTFKNNKDWKSNIFGGMYYQNIKWSAKLKIFQIIGEQQMNPTHPKNK